MVQTTLSGIEMRQLKGALVRTPVLGHGLLAVLRFQTAMGYFRRPLFNLVKWLFNSNELTNFTYDLEESNKRYLAALITDITNVEFDTVMAYIQEIEENQELRSHIATTTAKSDWAFMADPNARLGRRIGWYAMARAIKPKIIIETGVDKGLGSCVLTAALKKNKAEGYEGQYYGTNINPIAGYLLSDEYAHYGRILYGDSIASLSQLDVTIDLFINDSDHSADYEAEEYRIIENKLSDHAIILGDNSDGTDKLLEFSLKTNRHFVFFQEKPHEHWYPGAGIGFSFKR